MPLQDRRDLAAAVGLIGLVVAHFWRLLLRGEVLFDRDIGVLFHAQAEVFFASERAGSLPLWNPAMGFGEPLLANANMQVLYPPTWLMLLVPPGPYYGMSIVAHFAFGAMGFYALARHLGTSRAAAVTAAAAFVLSGPVLSLVNVMLNHPSGVCWMPWVVLAARRALRSGSAKGALWWAVAAAGQVLAGSLDMCALTAVAIVAAWWPAARVDLAALGARRIAGTIALAAVAGLALSAAQWLPTVAAAFGGGRSALPFEERAYWSVHPLTLPQILFPLPLRELPRLTPRTADLLEVWDPFLHSIYLGLPAAGFVTAALLYGDRRPRSVVALCVVALLVALGRHMPLYRWITAVVPMLAAFRFPAKVMALVAWAWALLVAFGFDAWRGRVGRAKGLAVVLGTLVLVTVAAAIGLLVVRPDAGPAGVAADVLHEAARRLLIAGAAGAVIVVVALRERPVSMLARPAIAAVAAVIELFVAHHGLNPTAPAEFYRYRPPVLAVLPQPPARLFVWDYVLSRPLHGPNLAGLFLDLAAPWPRELGGALALQTYLYPPLAGRWGHLGSFDRDLIGFTHPRTRELCALLVRAQETPAYLRLLQLGGVERVIALHDGHPGLVPIATIDGPFRAPIRIFAVPDARPRVYAVERAVVLDGEDALRRLVSAGFDPAQEVVLASTDSAAAKVPARDTRDARDARDTRDARDARVTVEEDAPDHLRVLTEAGGPAWVVRLSGFDSGWRVHVDDRRAVLRRANTAFQAVEVPAGRHVVDFRYRPLSVGAGVAVSGLAAGLLGAFVWRSQRPARPGRGGGRPRGGS